MTTTKSETIFQPIYNGGMRFAKILYPVWAVLTVYFIYQWHVTRSFSPHEFLAIVFGIMVVSLTFRVFREIRFGDKIIVKRYIQPDQVIEYKDVTLFDMMRLNTSKKGISLYMLKHDSLEEFEKIVHNLMSVRKIKLKKKL